MEENQLVFRKEFLIPIKNFVDALSITGGRLNRARYRLGQILDIKIFELNEERENLAKDYAVMNADGKPTLDTENRIIFKGETPDEIKRTEANFQREYIELLKEDTTANVSEYADYMINLITYLNDYDAPLSGVDGTMYGALYDALENAGYKPKGE